MHAIKAIGFDLFNTLITMDLDALSEAIRRLTRSLRGNGLEIDEDLFLKDYREAALSYIEKTRKDGKETHNRFWISAALAKQGHRLPPDDPKIAEAVESYFSAFTEFCGIIPGTKEMLQRLCGNYRLGMLSNFTHAPAARRIINHLDLARYFGVILISGEIGYRKPHPKVFEDLISELGVNRNEIIYVGDDPEPDIFGALNAGLQPVWSIYVRNRKSPYITGIGSQDFPEPDGNVPRISGWDDLFSLLAEKCV